MKNHINKAILLALGLITCSLKPMQNNQNCFSNIKYDEKGFKTIYEKSDELIYLNSHSLDILHSQLLSQKAADNYYKEILSAIYRNHSFIDSRQNELLALATKYIKAANTTAQETCSNEKYRNFIEKVGPYCNVFGGLVSAVSVPLAIISAYNQNATYSTLYTSFGLTGLGIAVLPKWNSTWNTVLRAKGMRVILEENHKTIQRVDRTGIQTGIQIR